MINKDKVYEAFGELLYAVAKVDGAIQDEERKVLDEILSRHPWGKDILWSFNYEEKKTNSVKDAYLKAMDIFIHHGPFEEYENFHLVLNEVALAFGGITEEEEVLIHNFRQSLLDAFKDNPNIQ
ncbi:MAG TPA: TerB family tellurite resistance protein [Cytophagaceae bacterium]